MKLGELAQVTRGIATGRDDAGGGRAYKVVQVRHMQDGRLAPTAELKAVHVPADSDPARFAIKRGDILVAMLGANPKVVVVDTDLRAVLADKEVAIVRPRSASAGKRIATHLRSEKGQAALAENRSGVTIAHMKLSALNDIDIP